MRQFRVFSDLARANTLTRPVDSHTYTPKVFSGKGPEVGVSPLGPGDVSRAAEAELSRLGT